MKPFFVILGIVILCVNLCSLRAQSYPADTEDVNWISEFETGLHSSLPHDVKTGETWDSGGGFYVGLNYMRPVTPKLKIRGGISHQINTASTRLHNPLPYMMYMDMNMHVYSIKFTATANYDIYKPSSGNGEVYVGLGLYGDMEYHSWGRKHIIYASGFDNDRLDMSNSFPLIVPGAQIAIGIQMPKSRLELRHWQDLKTFELPGIPINKQRLTGFGLTWSHYIAVNRHHKDK